MQYKLSLMLYLDVEHTVLFIFLILVILNSFPLKGCTSLFLWRKNIVLIRFFYVSISQIILKCSITSDQTCRWINHLPASSLKMLCSWCSITVLLLALKPDFHQLICFQSPENHILCYEILDEELNILIFRTLFECHPWKVLRNTFLGRRH